jgi:hypothetical protein
MLTDRFVGDLSAVGDHTTGENVVLQVDLKQFLIYVPVFGEEVCQVV